MRALFFRMYSLDPLLGNDTAAHLLHSTEGIVEPFFPVVSGICSIGYVPGVVILGIFILLPRRSFFMGEL